MCRYVRIYVSKNVQRPEAVVSTFLDHSLPYFETGSFTEPGTHQLGSTGWSANKPQGCFRLCLCSAGMKYVYQCIKFYIGAGHPHSSPQSCTAGHLTNEPCPQRQGSPSMMIFHGQSVQSGSRKMVASFWIHPLLSLKLSTNTLKFPAVSADSQHSRSNMSASLLHLEGATHTCGS